MKQERLLGQNQDDLNIKINFIQKKLEQPFKMFTDVSSIIDLKMFEESLVAHGVNESEAGEILKRSPFGRLLQKEGGHEGWNLNMFREQSM